MIPFQGPLYAFPSFHRAVQITCIGLSILIIGCTSQATVKETFSAIILEADGIDKLMRDRASIKYAFSRHSGTELVCVPVDGNVVYVFHVDGTESEVDRQEIELISRFTDSTDGSRSVMLHTGDTIRVGQFDTLAIDDSRTYLATTGLSDCRIYQHHEGALRLVGVIPDFTARDVHLIADQLYLTGTFESGPFFKVDSGEVIVVTGSLNQEWSPLDRVISCPGRIIVDISPDATLAIVDSGADVISKAFLIDLATGRVIRSRLTPGETVFVIPAMAEQLSEYFPRF